ncbi:MAG: hypothetical protein ACPG4T_12880, partial [Nannocystaceae bacterium]
MHTTTHADCDGIVSTTFETTASVPFPEKLGTLVASEVYNGDVSEPASAMCNAPVQAAIVEVELDALAPPLWKDFALSRTFVNGKAW